MLSGRPAVGSGSLARFGRRLAALLIDWLSARLISVTFFGDDALATLAIFFLATVLMVGTMGASPGHLLLGMRVLRADGAWAGPVRATVRTAALCAVIPAAVYDSDGRGMHDRLAGTVLVRR